MKMKAFASAKRSSILKIEDRASAGGVIFSQSASRGKAIQDVKKEEEIHSFRKEVVQDQTKSNFFNFGFLSLITFVVGTAIFFKLGWHRVVMWGWKGLGFCAVNSTDIELKGRRPHTPMPRQKTKFVDEEESSV